MGIMTTLRERAGIFMIVAIVLAIVAFVVSDAVQSGQGFLQASRNEVGVIAGEKVSYEEFDNKLQAVQENLKKQIQSNSLDASMVGYAVDQTWNQLISEIVLKKEVAKVGLNVGAEELFDMVQGKNVHPEVRRAFTNPQDGVFDPQQVIRFLQNLDQDGTGETRKQWLAFEKSITDQRLQEKYFNLIKGGLYVTKAQVEDDETAKLKTATIQYVLTDYSTVADSAVSITDADIKEYYANNRYKYKQKEEQRSFEYVVFDANPSAEDSAEAKGYLTDKLAELANSTNDSLYIALNAETKSPLVYLKKGRVSPTLDSIIYSKSVGYVYGPYLEGNTFKLAKLSAVKSLPDSVKARHILIKPIGNDMAKTKAKADSILGVLKAGGNFAELAKKYSDDGGSGAKGGDLGYFAAGMMVKPFEDACFNGNKDALQLVQSQFGYHIIQVQDQKNFSTNYKIAVLDRSIEAGDKTVQAAFAKGNAFLANATAGADAFNKAAADAKITKRVAEKIGENDKTVPGLTNPKEIVRWAYKADKGDVSTLFDLGNGYAVACLTEVREEGYAALEYVKADIEAAVRVEKKAKLLMDKMSGAKSLVQAAEKVQSKVDTATGVSFAGAVIPGVAREPKVIGAVVGMKAGTISKPLQGERGVYMVQLSSFAPMPPKTDLNQGKAQLLMMMQSRVDGQVFQVLKETAGVKDNRAKFY